MRIVLRLVVFVAGLVVGPMLLAVDAGQSSTQPAERTYTGVVVSSSEASLILLSDDGEYSVFALDRDTVRPKSLPAGSQVKVVERANTTTDGIPVADAVVTTADVVATPAGAQSNVPPAMRRVERQIRRQASRYRVGGYGSVAIDPELVMIGARGSFGPIFDSNVSFRPNVELGFGELTTLLGVNLDAVYHVGRREQRRRWVPYFGFGIALAFSHENLERELDGRSFDFGEYDLDSGVNFIAGIEHDNNIFLQLVSTAYSAPHVRFLVGVNFW